MAIFTRTSTNWIFSLKVLVISIGVISMAVILKLSVPVVLEFIVSDGPVVWSSLRSWLTPPYLYVVINGIIITIAASSRLQQKLESVSTEKIPDDVQTDSDFSVSSVYEDVVLENTVEVRSEIEVLDPPVYEESEIANSQAKTIVSASDNVEDDFVIPKSTWTLNRKDSMEIPMKYSSLDQKPLVSVRFGHRKTVRASPEAGKTLGVSKPKRNDTLESTWKMITDGRSIPLARHLKKSDTWETHGPHDSEDGAEDQSPPPPKMKKAGTFNNQPPGLGKLLKEPSPSQDELNRRVEAFIKKFNQEMRLQREESLNQYKEIVNRGTY